MARLLENNIKDILYQNGIKVPKSRVVDSPEAVAEAINTLRGQCVVKALIPVGKKGKAGMVRMVDDPQSGMNTARELLGTEYCGFRVENLLVEKRVDIELELFVSITYDNLTRLPVLLFSPKGGKYAEEMAARFPEMLFKVQIPILEGLHSFKAREVCFQAGLTKVQTTKVSLALVKIYDLFFRFDAKLLEINPLAITSGGDVCAVGGIMNIDEESLFRHPDLEGLVCYGQERSLGGMTERERRVVEVDQAAPESGAVRYTEFPEGDIAFGIIGGGASLTAMDAILRNGGQPANYCDLGPGKALNTKLETLFETIITKPGIKAIITGITIVGATDISNICKIIIHLLEKNGVDPTKMPVVARWAGIGDEQVRRDFEAIAGVHYFGSEISIERAAEKVVELLNERKQGEPPS